MLFATATSTSTSLYVAIAYARAMCAVLYGVKKLGEGKFKPITILGFYANEERTKGFENLRNPRYIYTRV